MRGVDPFGAKMPLVSTIQPGLNTLLSARAPTSHTLDRNPMNPDTIREDYLSFYEAQGHSRHPSDSLVPADDPTLLFTGAGMNQFKAMFLGRGNLPFSRATTSQKCLRMPDLDNVGRTTSHHTFFEMLGNFSFGDYFKREAITWAWQLLGKWGIPADRLSVTVYLDDDEAADIWADEVGLPRERIFRYGEEDNFWPASAPSKGPNGICGPCSEIYFDWHPEEGVIPPGGPAEDGRRFAEIWNLVFTQFERRDGGELVPLPQKNIDTGMGFERTVRVLESLERGVVLPSNFESSLFTPLVDAVHEHVGRSTEFGTLEGERVRRIVDHVRAATFCVSDGVRPSNVKQGYVVRKVLRRAMIDRHILGGDLRQPWLTELSARIIDEMSGAWPELRDAQSVITSAIALEEEKFASSFLSASQKLHGMADAIRESQGSDLGAKDAFLLYDTFGLPLDLQKMLLDEHGLGVDEEGYRGLMAEQRRRSKESSKISDSIFDEGPLGKVAEKLPETEFVRDTVALDTTILAIVDDDETDDETDGEGDAQAVIVVLDRTPFYAEGGGQVGDAGTLRGDGFTIEIDDTIALRGISLHRGFVTEGTPVAGPVHAVVDDTRRSATARNHTGTHLLHNALRAVLGDEVAQAGSLVTPDRLRFDFRFPRGMTDEEIAEVEDIVNRWTLANRDVAAAEMSLGEAREQGAIALFGEKYGDRVRVVRVPGAGAPGGDSVEFCGGTHVGRSGDIGLLKILSEGSVAAGIRRIEARTGLGVIDHLRHEEGVLSRSAALFKSSPDRLEERIDATQAEVKSLRKELAAARAQMAEANLASSIRDWHGLRAVVGTLEGLPVKMLREIAGDYAKRQADIVVLAIPEDETTSYIVALSKAGVARGLSAKTMVDELAAAFGGKGGGNPTFAQGRGGAHDDVLGVLESVLDRQTPDGATTS